MRGRLPALALALVLLTAGCSPQEAALHADAGTPAPSSAQEAHISPPGTSSTNEGSESSSPPTEEKPSPSAGENSPGPGDSSQDDPVQEDPSQAGGGMSPLLGRVVPAVLIVCALGALAWLLLRMRRTGGKEPRPGGGRDIRLPPAASSADGKEGVLRVANLHNIGRRREQQDSFCISDVSDGRALRKKGLLAVVADGMGGLQDGAAISQLVSDTFRGRYVRLDLPDPDAFLLDSARQAETAAEEYMRQAGTDGGSTLVAVLIRDGMLRFVSVGDSKLYLLRDGQLIQINHEHTFGNLLREKAARGEVDPEEPFVNPRRDALVAYIGMGSLNTVDRSASPIPLAFGDKVLLCSDGVSNALGQEALIAAMEGDVLEAAQRMEEAILSQQLPEQDNFTGVLVEYAAPPAPSPSKAQSKDDF